VSYNNSKDLIERFTKEAFSRCISFAHINSKLSEEKFASIIGVSKAQLRDYKSGMSLPRVDNYFYICSVLGADFFCDVLPAACLGDEVSIVSNANESKYHISEVAIKEGNQS